MTTHDAVTRLLDARRLQGLLTNQSGRVIALGKRLAQSRQTKPDNLKSGSTRQA